MVDDVMGKMHVQSTTFTICMSLYDWYMFGNTGHELQCTCYAH